jgi:hypothetical protein
MNIKKLWQSLGCALLMVVVLSANVAAQNQKKRKPTIEVLILQVSAQLDQMEQDRGNQLNTINALLKRISDAESGNLDRNIDIARTSARQREAIVSSDVMIGDPKEQTRPTALAEFLRRSAVRDQALFDTYVKQAAEMRFSRERQVAKIKSEITLIQSLRRDLEKLKKFPTDAERARFFLDSAQVALDAITAAKEKASGQ